MKSCIVCNSQGYFSHKYKSKSTIFDNKDIFSCNNCEYSWAAEIDQYNLNSYYVKNYDLEISRSKKFLPPEQYFFDIKKQFKPDRSELHLTILKKYTKKKSKPLILDIGSGFGTTLNLSKNFFEKPEIYAYENDENSIKYLNFINANILTGDCISSLKNLDKKFDIIILSHFLEHVSPQALKEFIDIIYKMLNLNGILLVEVPHDNWIRYPERKYSDPPHVSFFSILSLKKVFDKFKIIKCTSIREPKYSNSSIFLRLISKIYLKLINIIYKLINISLIPYSLSKNGTSLLLVARK
tara:strand:- start:37263 stop:38150 length:888 start_codon:yes stop_codon:yes gene_type:complete